MILGGNARDYQNGDKSMSMQLRTEEEMSQFYEFKDVHMKNEVTNNLFNIKESARMTKVKELQRYISEKLKGSILQKSSKEEESEVQEQ